MEDRITELEVKLAFAEDLLDTLNTTVYRQQERIAQLERSLRDLRQLVLQAIPAEQRSLRDEIPPHY
ncbi:MAG: SlyX family protein [Rhodocyclaceae bacterium]